jgi:hypothetical protein
MRRGGAVGWTARAVVRVAAAKVPTGTRRREPAPRRVWRTLLVTVLIAAAAIGGYLLGNRSIQLPFSISSVISPG